MLYQDKSFKGLVFLFCLGVHSPKNGAEVNFGKSRVAALPKKQLESKLGKSRVTALPENAQERVKVQQLQCMEIHKKPSLL
ncbi:hypothetical protein DYI25_21395 [Mesobacillus boroniphilus]|uniref:Uncharacterized protein n=1 Tax=Mesobacillus boroniphilus TaxID=308892 RepID=A0A944GZJ3_9BACI|nr:hypothetical protein [Mesobacillus boroniphilus]MBS8266980.1 hypothetical protein [Mesobacillus boroniphilus]